ncbi:hypothetical protein K1719_023080 [Acacia pycnantha]|nr:hypothetical protein K1719_023080 [Acacia pycnantha]
MLLAPSIIGAWGSRSTSFSFAISHLLSCSHDLNLILLQHSKFPLLQWATEAPACETEPLQKETFDGKREREDLALKLLNNDLNQEKRNLYYKARRHYAQVEKQDDNKRLRLDTSKEYFEDVERERKDKYDDFDKRGNGHDDLEKGPPQSTSLKDQLIHSDRGQIQANDAEDEERTQDLQMMKRYVFECLRPKDNVIVFPLSHLTQDEFITLKPETYLDSLVIDTFVEILTDFEQKKKTMPLNWYLPVTFSDAALKGEVGYFLNFVHCQKMKENYMSDLESCEKIFIPVHVGARPNGHFYLYIIHLKNKEIEIWDSLHNTSEAEIEETTKKLLTAMEKLFEKVTFTEFHRKMADDILLQPNEFDCGVFVINYMQQSDNYVKRESSFQFDSQREREDLALKLLNNDLNKEKQNLYDKARRHYAQVETHDGNKDDSNEEDDDSDEGDGLENGMSIDSDEDNDGLENDLIVKEFQIYTKQIREWIKDDKVSVIGVWGMGGSGKTALASHVYDKLLEEGDMKVIWVTVSQNSIYKLQKVIARSIKLDISDEYEVKRIARKLSQAFREMKKCVVILDDVWDHFFLKDVGFPMSDNRIKLILTTRIWEVCQGMGCDQKNKIEVGPLDMNDSQALFKKTMRSYEELSLGVKRIALNVAYNCEGLPLAIVRIATSMKGKKQVGEWSNMLECLENLGNGQYEMDKWVLPVLRSSYDFLTNKLQRFFLYYVLNTNNDFLNDDDVDRFIRRFVYESIDETKKFRVLLNEGYNMLDNLKNHSMFGRFDEGWRMHKFLRALAIGIAEDTGKIMVNAYKNLTEIPSDDQWREDLQKVFLMGNMIQTIPNGLSPRCSKLSILLLDGNEDLNYISDDFFNNMLALKTLDLSKTRIKCLPKSVSSLKCLNALLLSGCKELSYIPPLRNLKWLILLDLSLTAITEVPLGLESLINFRCLNLVGTPNLVISASVISKLISLEHLELNVTKQEGIQDILPGDMDQFSIEGCHQEIGASSLCRALSYGRQIEQLEIIQCKDVKSLCCLSSLCPFCSSSQLVGRLCLWCLEDLKDIVPPDALLSLYQPSIFSHLTDLEIFNCKSMETLMTPMLLALVRNLRTILVRNCWKMKKIVGEDDHSKMELGGGGDLSHPTPITLPMLTSLELDDMPQLNFRSQMDVSFPWRRPHMDTVGELKLINQDMVLLCVTLKPTYHLLTLQFRSVLLNDPLFMLCTSVLYFSN